MPSENSDKRYYVYELVGPMENGYIKMQSPPQKFLRSIHETEDSAIEAASEYERWEFEKDLEIGDLYPHAIIVEVDVYDAE